MSIVSRRNAVLGWVALAVAKRVLKRKAKAIVPTTVKPKKRKRFLALLIAGGVGVTTFLRIRSSGDDAAA
ncbi:MAG TPA: hypothetical protein VG652_03075 [Gaiellaceae bacterium]|nr:hypothetical protein [Gaiellaceae bacterium]